MTTANRWPAVQTVPFRPTHVCLLCDQPVAKFGPSWYVQNGTGRKPHVTCRGGYSVSRWLQELPKKGKDK